MLKGTPIETGYYSFLERHIIPLLISLKLKPNDISFLGLLASLLAGMAFVFSPFVGGLLTLLTGLLDTLDGSLARATGQSRKFGAFLDSVLDRYTELLIYIGIWFFFYRQQASTPLISLALLLILFGSLMVSYTRARAEGLGEPCLVGVFQRGGTHHTARTGWDFQSNRELDGRDADRPLDTGPLTGPGPFDPGGWYQPDSSMAVPACAEQTPRLRQDLARPYNGGAESPVKSRSIG